MSKSSAPTNALDLLDALRSHTIAPKAITFQMRREVVMLLMSEGASSSEMARLLSVTERTIRRDKEAIRTEGAKEFRGSVSEQIVAELLQRARDASDRLVRLSREPGSSVGERADAIASSIKSFDLALARAQDLGVLPKATQKLDAEIKHSSDELTSLDEIAAEAKRLLDISSAQLTASAQSVPTDEMP